MNFKELDHILGEVKSFGMPKLYNLYKDPGEQENVLFPFGRDSCPYTVTYSASG